MLYIDCNTVIVMTENYCMFHFNKVIFLMLQCLNVPTKTNLFPFSQYRNCVLTVLINDKNNPDKQAEKHRNTVVHLSRRFTKTWKM